MLLVTLFLIIVEIIDHLLKVEEAGGSKRNIDASLEIPTESILKMCVKMLLLSRIALYYI